MRDVTFSVGYPFCMGTSGISAYIHYFFVNRLSEVSYNGDISFHGNMCHIFKILTLCRVPVPCA